MVALSPCPWCGGYAALGDDDDDSIWFESFHEKDCPISIFTEEDKFQRWFYPDDYEVLGVKTREQAKRLLIERWNKRTGNV